MTLSGPRSIGPLGSEEGERVPLNRLLDEVQLFGRALVVAIRMPANTATKALTRLKVVGSPTSELFRPPFMYAFREKQKRTDAVSQVVLCRCVRGNGRE
jgi:hypothetical protein